MNNKDKFNSDYLSFTSYFPVKESFPAPEWGQESEDVISFSPYGTSDAVNSPAHYTRGKQEAIEIIEEAIQDAPDVKCGMLQAQALKYLLRVWLKDNSKQDLEKARWYLNRLIDSL